MYDDLLLNSHQSTYYELTQNDGLLVGNVTAIEILPHPEVTEYYVLIENLYINPCFRRQGLATSLLKKIIQDNPDAIAFVLRCEAGESKGMGDHPMNDKQLHDWYVRFGFYDGSQFYDGDGPWMQFNPVRLELII